MGVISIVLATRPVLTESWQVNLSSPAGIVSIPAARLLEKDAFKSTMREGIVTTAEPPFLMRQTSFPSIMQTIGIAQPIKDFLRTMVNSRSVSG